MAGKSNFYLTPQLKNATTAGIMDPKRWFAWVCLALMVVAEIFLFRAIREKDAALTSQRQAQAEVWQAQKELEDMKNSNTGQQAAEISRLRKQNEIYTNRLAKAQAMIDQLEAEVAQTAQSLTTARTALQLQQTHLQQLQTENQIVTDAGVAIVHRNTCINNLRQIDAAKQQWALEKNKADADVPAAQNLLPYLKDAVFPVCPEGGIYLVNAVDLLPTCSIAGHVLP